VRRAGPQREGATKNVRTAQGALGALAGVNYSIPSRSNASQLYLPELDRIVLRGDRTTRKLANVATARCVQQAKEIASGRPHSSPVAPWSEVHLGTTGKRR